MSLLFLHDVGQRKLNIFVCGAEICVMYENLRAKYSLASSIDLNLLLEIFVDNWYVDSMIFIINVDFLDESSSIKISFVCFGFENRLSFLYNAWWLVDGVDKTLDTTTELSLGEVGNGDVLLLSFFWGCKSFSFRHSVQYPSRCCNCFLVQEDCFLVQEEFELSLSITVHHLFLHPWQIYLLWPFVNGLPLKENNVLMRYKYIHDWKLESYIVL